LRRRPWLARTDTPCHGSRGSQAAAERERCPQVPGSVVDESASSPTGQQPLAWADPSLHVLNADRVKAGPGSGVVDDDPPVVADVDEPPADSRHPATLDPGFGNRVTIRRPACRSARALTCTNGRSARRVNSNRGCQVQRRSLAIDGRTAGFRRPRCCTSVLYRAGIWRRILRRLRFPCPTVACEALCPPPDSPHLVAISSAQDVPRSLVAIVAVPGLGLVRACRFGRIYRSTVKVITGSDRACGFTDCPDGAQR
jgi:hypothetical protein